MVLLMERAKLVVEGAGAVGVAALLAGLVAPAADGHDGGRALRRQRRRRPARAGRAPPRDRGRAAAARLHGASPTAPAGSRRCCCASRPPAATCSRVEHVREAVDLQVRQTGVELTLETRGAEHAEAILAAMAAAGYAARARLSGRAPSGRSVAATRSRCGSIRQRAAAARCSSRSDQRSGRSSPSWSGDRALERHAAGVVADRADRARRRRRRATRARAAAPRARRACPRSAARVGPASWISVGATQATGLVGEVPRAGQLQHREAVALRDRAHPLDARAGLLDPAGGAEGAMVAGAERLPGGDVVVEQRRRSRRRGRSPHARRRRGAERELAGPRLERVEDQHRPVDQRAEALEAVDHVEREAVRRARARRRAGASGRRRAARPCPSQTASLA